MSKPFYFKLVASVVVVVVLIAATVLFFNFWPAKPAFKLSGEVQAREFRNGSRFGGRVLKVLVQEGQMVKQGQPLVIFEGSDLDAKIADAKATLAQALAQEKLLAKGADIGQVRQAGAGVQQAQQRLKMLSSGGRPEEVAQAQSKVQIAENQLDQARKAVENAKTMLEEGIISRQKYESLTIAAETAQSNLNAANAALSLMKSGGRSEEKRIASAQLSAAKAQYGQLLEGAEPEEFSIASANVEKARSNLKALEAQLGELNIQAPSVGYVSVVAVTPGELVPAGRPVVTIIDYDRLWADVYMPESKLVALSIQPGAPVSVVTQSSKTTRFEGRVAVVNPKSEFVPNSGGDSSSEESTFRLKINIANKDVSGKTMLYPGMKVDVYFNP
ncbi:HlyD family secretion protein [Vampirovibrio sp.]|uniref:HlyD family secretion protein n=1 Tax=Vampirovibrio sp. TaxID=2717857 RepID=UPI003593251E